MSYGSTPALLQNICTLSEHLDSSLCRFRPKFTFRYHIPDKLPNLIAHFVVRIEIESVIALLIGWSGKRRELLVAADRNVGRLGGVVEAVFGCKYVKLET